MKSTIENTYGNAAKKIMKIINPVKKKIIKTYCTVHKYINIKAIDILRNNGYDSECNFFRKYIRCLNEGTVFADQDFKSSNHFYNIDSGKGLYGFSNALLECENYYDKAEYYLKNDDIRKSIFYLGAAIHLIQDATVPYHVNNSLLKNHRKFELWISKRLLQDYQFEEKKKIKRFNSIKQYINNNAVTAIKVYKEYYNIDIINNRYEKIASVTIKEAQITTAGILLDYYDLYKNSTIND